MAGRGPQSFKKRQKEQQRKERQQEKAAKRLQRAANRAAGITEPEEPEISPADDEFSTAEAGHLQNS
jgi:hypothetical protein